MGALAGHEHAAPAAETATERPAAPSAPLTARVLQLQGTIGNRAVGRLLRQTPSASASAPAPAAAAPAVTAGPGEMTREHFERTMFWRFGVPLVRNGTEREMIVRTTRRGVTPPTALPGWHDWNPGPSSTVYQAIVDAFEDIDRTFGGVPDVREIVFFDADYDWNGTAFVRRSDVGASFGAGHLTIHRAIESHSKGLPVARSNARGRYPTVVIGLQQPPDQVEGAPIPLPSRAESQRRIIAHELGHGLAEAAHGPTPDLAPDPTMMTDFRLAVGWTATEPAELFDAGDAAVRRALAAGTRPAAPAQPITELTWNAAHWGEQPVSSYAVSGGPGEDFAESVMAFVRAPELLRARSPRRYAFLDQHRSRWTRNLVRVAPPGDYPLPRDDGTRIA